MRTTLTLDPDVAVELERIRRRRGVPFKRVVNDAIRAGLPRLDEPAAGTPFRTRPLELGRSLVGNLDNVAEVLEMVEDHRI